MKNLSLQFETIYLVYVLIQIVASLHISCLIALRHILNSKVNKACVKQKVSCCIQIFSFVPEAMNSTLERKRKKLSNKDAKDIKSFPTDGGYLCYIFYGIQWIGIGQCGNSLIFHYDSEDFYNFISEIGKLLHYIGHYKQNYCQDKPICKTMYNEDVILDMHYDGNQALKCSIIFYKKDSTQSWRDEMIVCESMSDLMLFMKHLQKLFCLGLSDDMLFVTIFHNVVAELAKTVHNEDMLLNELGKLDDINQFCKESENQPCNMSKKFLFGRGKHAKLLALLMNSNAQLEFRKDPYPTDYEKKNFEDILHEITSGNNLDNYWLFKKPSKSSS